MAKWPQVETPLDGAWTLAPVQVTFPGMLLVKVLGCIDKSNDRKCAAFIAEMKE